MPPAKIYRGDCLEVLASLPASSIESLITDPPAGISFMGKDWDSDKGGPKQWIGWLSNVMREALRVLKPGAHGLVWALPRTSHWTATALEDAGFEIRDCLYHIFGTGFPKSKNLGRGRGTALKPAVECWWLVRKPYSEKNIAANLRKWGTGALNIDRCRIEFQSEADRQSSVPGGKVSYTSESWGQQAGLKKDLQPKRQPPLGRFPSHLVLDDVAAKALDEQSGLLAGPGNRRTRTEHSASESKFGMGGGEPTVIHDRGGGASRFFYVAKPSRRERNAGLESRAGKAATRHGARPTDWEEADWKKRNANHHPTVKPIALMRYLCRLVTPPGGTVLDPFAGSGTTGIAAKREGFRFIGIEQAREYVAIARRRIKAG